MNAKTLLSFLCLTLLTGCASIFDSGSVKPISLASEPSGAKVTITDRKGAVVSVQATPTTVALARSHGFGGRQKYSLTFELAGYAPAQALVSSSTNPWYLGNFLFGGFFGMIIDISNGTCFTLSPRQVTVRLAPCAPTVSTNAVATAPSQP